MRILNGWWLMPAMSKCIPMRMWCDAVTIKVLPKVIAEFNRENLPYGKKTAMYATCVSRLSTKRGLNTKIHLAVDAHGMPVRFFVADATVADCSVAESLISDFRAEYLLADRDYDTNAIIQNALQAWITPVIPPKKNRKILREYDKHVYKLRHLVENAFLHFKRWRGIATRYAKNVASFVAAVQIRYIALWLKLYWRHGLALYHIYLLLGPSLEKGTLAEP